MKRYNVGDRVRVRTRQDLVEQYGEHRYHKRPEIPYGMNEEMERFLGKEMTISMVIDATEYKFKEDNCKNSWHPDVFKPVSSGLITTEQLSSSSFFTTQPNEGITISADTIRVGKLQIDDKGDIGMFGLDFGKVKKGEFKVSQYGLAVAKADGKYVSYDKENKCLMDVSLLNFDASKFMFRMPVAMDAVKAGDVLIIDGKTVAVHKILSDGHLKVMDYRDATVKEVVPTKNMFGFNYYTKLVNMFSEGLNESASSEQPFGNMLPLMMMGEDVDPMMFMMVQGGQFDMSNPMMLMAMMDSKGSGSKDSMMQMLMMQQFMTQTKTKTEA